MQGLAVVTGASSGIGEAYAERLAADGWDLLVVARRAERLEELAARLTDAHGVSVRAIEADLSRLDDVRRVCGEIEAQPVEALVNNAGLAHYMPFAELPAARASELVELNAHAPVLLTRAAITGMLERRSGSIVNVASLLAFSGAVDGGPWPQRTVYAATKSFLVVFSQLLAAEVRDRGVRVQVVCPGVVRSEFHTRQGRDMSGVPRMEADQVVRASLADLADGVVVCIPALEDLDEMQRVQQAQAELLRLARTTELPRRYAARPS